VATGQPFAFITLPAFGPLGRFTLIQGTALAQLDLSPGHVPGTQWPGQVGNFAVAGHRVTAGNPFWFNGKVPVLSFNTALFGRSGPASYNGTTRVDSGLPLGPKTADFKVKFLTAGTYKYTCDVHYGMRGVVIVKPKGAAVPSAQQNASELKAEEQHFAAEAKRVAKTRVHGNNVSALRVTARRRPTGA